jgi:hypothetical protein
MVASRAVVDLSGIRDTEQRLSELARAGGPLRRVVAGLAARLVEKQGWSRLGFARLGDYARERLGLSARSVQEFARVGARLGELPALEGALVSGQLPWSKVRLLARFVTTEDAGAWVAYATRVGVRQLEGELRAADRGSLEAGSLGRDEERSQAPSGGASSSEPTRWVRLRVPAPLSFKWQRVRKYAAKVEGQSLSAGDALERVTAEVLSALPVELVMEDGNAPGVVDTHCAGVPTEVEGLPANVCASHSAESADECLLAAAAELPAFLLPLLANLDAADPFELDARLRRAVRLEQRLDSQLAPLLREVTSAEYEWKERYASLEVFARECLGMSPRKARALLRVERVGEVCPELRGAYRDGALSWVQAQILTPLLLSDAEGDWREAWVAFAATVTVRRLTVTVERARLWRKANPAAFEVHRDFPEYFAEPDPGEERGERQTCARPKDVLGGVRLRISAPHSVARLFDAVLCTLRRAIERETGQLASEAEAFEAMLDHALASWAVDDFWLRTRMKKRHYAVFERDDWRCVFPGCTSHRNLHAHHIVFRSANGGNELPNLTTLCAFHHQRGVHEGRVTVRGRAPDGLEFELGTRQGRSPLARYRSGDRVAALPHADSA